jgi:hypothetical protein
MICAIRSPASERAHPSAFRLLVNCHTQAATTQRYAHLSNDPVRAAAEAIGSRIDAAMNRESAK